MLESLILSGWVPVGWILGQIAIGLICGIAYKKCNSNVVKIFITLIAMLIGIAGIKTLVESKLYSIPLVVKLSKNLIATISDTIPMVIGMFIGNKIKDRLK